jgi:hypothetical protein
MSTNLAAVCYLLMALPAVFFGFLTWTKPVCHADTVPMFAFGKAGYAFKGTSPNHPMPARRFPAPWTFNEANHARFIVRDGNRFPVAYVYFEAEPGRRSSHDEGRGSQDRSGHRQAAGAAGEVIHDPRGAGAAIPCEPARPTTAIC